MSMESKILEMFKSLLGDKYKIVPINDDEKNVNDGDETIDRTKVKETDSGLTPNNDDETEEETFDFESYEDDEDDDSFDFDDLDDLGNLDEERISAEAQAMFERDKEKYGISIKSDQEEEDADLGERDAKLINEAQAVYDKIIEAVTEEIKNLDNTGCDSRELYINILQTSDYDDPYRIQEAEVYSTDFAQEAIDRLKRIKSDPFYGKMVLKDPYGKRSELYIGRSAYHTDDVNIVSAWSKLGEFFRSNRVRHEHYYELIHKYTYIVEKGKIVGVKDDSPKQ